MQRVQDRVKETTTSTGLGNIALLGAVTQFASFFSRFFIGQPIFYTIAGQSGTEWEVGIGHITDSATLVRDVVLSSSNSTGTVLTGIIFNFVNFSAGTKDVFNTVPSYRIAITYSQGQATAASCGMALP